MLFINMSDYLHFQKMLQKIPEPQNQAVLCGSSSKDIFSDVDYLYRKFQLPEKCVVTILVL